MQYMLRCQDMMCRHRETAMILTIIHHHPRQADRMIEFMHTRRSVPQLPYESEDSSDEEDEGYLYSYSRRPYSRKPYPRRSYSYRPMLANY